ncbi:MAG: serine/threonine-protein kinase, partial [Victivallales bacterium]|nr:serine/threonine-protein kinase [Victivallales bacterium]
MKYFCDKCESYTERDKDKCCRQCGADLRDAALAPETVLAGFVIHKELGRGANGVVYLAEQRSLGRKVALKVLSDAKSEDPDFVTAFLKEARAAARLNHPAIIQVYDAGLTDDGIYFLAMEFVDGKSLEQVFQGRPMKADKAVRIALELARALDYSWNKEQMFHGDIKPDNVMIRKDGQTKLADFGLAKTVFDEKNKNDEIMATPMYAPPEVIRAEHDRIGFKSDMYSFGVTLYEILCGAAPFTDGDYQQILARHLNEKPVPLSEKLPETDKSLSALIDRLLRKDPEKRPPSWRRVIEILEAVQTRVAVARSQFNWGTFIAVLLVIGALAGVVFLFYYEFNSGTGKPPATELRRRDFVSVAAEPVPLQPPPGKVNNAPLLPPDDSGEDESAELAIKAETKQFGLERLLRAAENLNGKTIWDISHLRFQVMKKLRTVSLPAAEKVELQRCLKKLNTVIVHRQQAAAAAEITVFRGQLAQEKLLRSKRRNRDRDIAAGLAGRNDIFKMLAAFLEYPGERRTRQEMRALLKKSREPDRKLPEYAALVFLENNLPRKYDREAVIFANVDRMTGKELPWKIRNLRYTVTGGSRPNIHLRTELSKNVYSRRKIAADKLSDRHWAMLVAEFLLKDNMKMTPDDIRNTACWLLFNADNELFEKFVRKYCPE